MSGGHFICQWPNEIADELESIILNNKNAKEDNKFSSETILKFVDAVEIIRKAVIYIHRIDWLLSGDDGEKEFLERLEEELTEEKRPVIHGKTCNKVKHVGTGYLHDANDDTTYDVDGCIYCGRCHRAIA